MFHINITPCSLGEKNQELVINQWAYQAILYSPFTLPWDFADEEEKKYSLLGLLSSLEHKKLEKALRLD